MVFSTKNVDLKYDQKQILKNVTTNFEQYKFNAIIGPNGCGKSSLIKLFAKINKPNDGQILFFDEQLALVKRKDFAKKVAFFFQFNDAVSDITVEQMVAFGRSAHKKVYQSLNDADLEIIDFCISKCDLNNLRTRIVSSLSGGERQRVYLAMTLAQEPSIIVLDEPTNHLDIKYQFQLLTLVRDIMNERKLTIICILHDFNQVLKYADNTLILSNGQVYASGKTIDVITEQSVKEVFGINSVIHRDENGAHIDFLI